MSKVKICKDYPAKELKIFSSEVKMMGHIMRHLIMWADLPYSGDRRYLDSFKFFYSGHGCKCADVKNHTCNKELKCMEQRDINFLISSYKQQINEVLMSNRLKSCHIHVNYDIYVFKILADGYFFLDIQVSKKEYIIKTLFFKKTQNVRKTIKQRYLQKEAMGDKLILHTDCMNL